MWAKQWCGTRMAAGWRWICLWTLPCWQNSHALAIRVMDLAICGSKIHSRASRPIPPASVFRHLASQSGTRAIRYCRLGSLTSEPDCSRHRHFYTFRYRTDSMPYSPAFRIYIKELYEGRKGYTLHVYTNAPSVISQRAEWTILVQ